jgi:hypothetical protein
MAKTSRHCIPAEDSTTINVVVPKTLKKRVRGVADLMSHSVSDAVRGYIVEGVQRDEDKIRKTGFG